MMIIEIDRKWQMLAHTLTIKGI